MNLLTIKVRTLLRRLGLVKFHKVLYPQREYEGKFSASLLESVSPGDTVWDIGANVGFYTGGIAKRAGHHGKVLAFEPAPSTPALDFAME